MEYGVWSKKPHRLLITYHLLLITLFLTPIVSAHGTNIDWAISDTVVTITARYETGDPISNASITVYAPDNPQVAIETGSADQNGIYTFEIDPAQTGTWSISVRDNDGHGEIVNIPYGGTSASGTTAIPPAVRYGVMAFVILGLGAVAFIFSRNQQQEPTHARS